MRIWSSALEISICWKRKILTQRKNGTTFTRNQLKIRSKKFNSWKKDGDYLRQYWNKRCLIKPDAYSSKSRSKGCKYTWWSWNYKKWFDLVIIDGTLEN